MVTMQAVGLPTSSYVTDTVLKIEDKSSDDEPEDDEPENPITIVNHATGLTTENGKPLLFIYDCKTTVGSHLHDHIMEVGSVVSILDGVSISNADISNLCHTSQHITHQGKLSWLLLYCIIEICSVREMWHHIVRPLQSANIHHCIYKLCGMA